MLRLATFNVENLFSRPAVMNLDSWADGRAVLNDVERLNALLAKSTYTDNDRAAIAEILERYQFYNRNIRPERRPFNIHEVREKLYKVPKGTKTVEVVADGREAWIGWVELTRAELPGAQIENTGRVVDAVRPDIACLVECEDRISLDRFNDQVLGAFNVGRYAYDMVIDGNDPRGIDLGVISRLPITGMCSHLHRTDDRGNRIFSRDCAEYEITLTDGTPLWVLCNHFKSKGYGDKRSSDAKRQAQARATAEIYRERAAKADLVAVVGDLNDVPDSDPLDPLIGQTDLRDIATHPRWQGPIGTYGSGNAKGSKIDYILLSPALWDLVRDVGVERRGIWAPRSFKPFPQVTAKTLAASDHAALWVDLDLT